MSVVTSIRGRRVSFALMWVRNTRVTREQGKPRIDPAHIRAKGLSERHGARMATAGRNGLTRRHVVPRIARFRFGARAMAKNAGIHVGIGGWNFEEWRGTFYPKGLSQKKELAYVASKLTSTEVNATYYGSQKPETFARWREETPDGFTFALKASRFCTNKKVLAEAGPSIEKFFAQGLLELKEKLGPINWQFMETKKFEPADFEAFLKLLPKSVEGRAIRHAVEVRNVGFGKPEFIDMLRSYDVALIYTDKEDFPNLADVTAPFVYARLQRMSEKMKDGYAPKALDEWAARATEWAKGGAPKDLPYVGAAEKKPPKERDAFVYFINGYKPKAPFAAMAMIERLKG